MPRLSPILALAAVLIAPAGTHAQGRPGGRPEGRTDTRALTCAAVKAVVARAGRIVLASSATAYETVSRDPGACERDETGAPAYVPTVDAPSCFAGWRCRQRNSDGGQNP